MKFNNPEDIIALTPEWKGERFPDGRPKVADKYLDALYDLTLEELWKPIFVAGYEHQFVNIQPLHPEFKEDGSVKTTDITQSMFFAKNSAGDWVCYEMTAVDAGEWIEEVRLVFVKDGEVLSDTFVDAESAAVTCPLVSVPEGKTFKGWTVEEKDETGNTVLRLKFSPDETGVMNLPTGTVLTPMTLSPLFE